MDGTVKEIHAFWKGLFSRVFRWR